MTQINNRTFHNPPRAGDGTLHENQLEPDANWFGKSQAPQEEYIDDGLEGTRDMGQANPAPRTDRTPPTPAPDSKVEAERTSNRQQDTQEPLSPPDVFPYGDPGQQTDG